MTIAAIKRLLFKLFPAFIVTMAAWQFCGVSGLYDRVAAWSLDPFVAWLDPSGLIKGVRYRAGEFILPILFEGRKTGLNITAQDITSNMVVLIALYLASPMRPGRRYFRYFGLSIAGLFVIHLATLAITAQYALASTPEIARSSAYKAAATIPFVSNYVNFYIEYGMYLFVLALWGIYFARHVMADHHIK